MCFVFAYEGFDPVHQAVSKTQSQNTSVCKEVCILFWARPSRSACKSSIGSACWSVDFRSDGVWSFEAVVGATATVSYYNMGMPFCEGTHWGNRKQHHYLWGPLQRTPLCSQRTDVFRHSNIPFWRVPPLCWF